MNVLDLKFRPCLGELLDKDLFRVNYLLKSNKKPTDLVQMYYRWGLWATLTENETLVLSLTINGPSFQIVSR